MIEQINLAGSFTLPGTSIAVNRMGYGAMQLAGRDGNKLVWGPPRDVDAAIAVLRQAVASGVNRMDTVDSYGPHVTNHPPSQTSAPSAGSQMNTSGVIRVASWYARSM